MFKKNKNEKKEDKNKEKLKDDIELLRKKIKEIEYYEFKFKRRKAVVEFYTEAKKYCYDLLNEKKKQLNR